MQDLTLLSADPVVRPFYKPLHKSQDHCANNCKLVLLLFRDRYEIFSHETELAGGEGGERTKKNGIAGVMVYDDFWNLET